MKQILINNFKCLEGSFIYGLHENAHFDVSAFWDYYNSLVFITKETKENRDLDRKTTDMVCYTYSYIMRSLVWNFCPDDLYSISNLPADDLNLYVERLEIAFMGYIKGQVINDSSFELVNPTKQ
ncbi:Imm41 family immunity protein [Paenibacillus sp. J22TS3]|uniref:Imm41 family immunity protein n=1 Tax=Paenibacillus sp. J22TS3 TaxID=2807192 RepID=UPI001AFEAC94|nr:Imm41 family immunity protein [Paenibacillus sp. J22TS3]GIP21037.1 hypothetical protein J22TS3_13120 [Paenibacillus sp. J22TS3]